MGRMTRERQPGPPRLRVCGLLAQDRNVLLVRQRRGSSTYWLLPGGGVDRGETLHEALAREFREEVALAVTVREPLGIVESISPDGGQSRHTIQLVFRVELTSKQEDRAPSARDQLPGRREHAEPPARDPAIRELRWFSVDELTLLALHPPIADLIRSWLERPGGPFVAAGVRWVD